MIINLHHDIFLFNIKALNYYPTIKDLYNIIQESFFTKQLLHLNLTHVCPINTARY